MTNIEKHAMKILDISIDGQMISLKNNEPISCDELECGKCDLCRQGCCHHTAEREYASYMRSWATTEYVEKPKLTKKERQFCELVETGWIVRDRANNLWWYEDKPTKRDVVWGCITGDAIGQSALRNLGIHFDFVKWEGSEPWSVEDLLKLEVEE